MTKYTQQDKDYKWFRDNISNLFFNYGYSFLAIRKKKVIGVYNSLVDGYKDMMAKKEKLGTFLIQRCAPNNDENLQCVASMNFM